MITFDNPLDSFNINLGGSFELKYEHVVKKYTCCQISHRLFHGKWILQFIFLDSVGVEWIGTDWGDGNVYYIRKTSNY